MRERRYAAEPQQPRAGVDAEGVEDRPRGAGPRTQHELQQEHQQQYQVPAVSSHPAAVLQAKHNRTRQHPILPDPELFTQRHHQGKRTTAARYAQATASERIAQEPIAYQLLAAVHLALLRQAASISEECKSS